MKRRSFIAAICGLVAIPAKAAEAACQIGPVRGKFGGELIVDGSISSGISSVGRLSPLSANITPGRLAADAITASRIGGDLGSSGIAAGAIRASQISAGSITVSKEH